jgi:inner membrane protein involved in colicin E2 resistance
MTKSIAAIAAVFFAASLGWMILGGTIDSRTTTQDRELRAKVGQLWGTPLDQNAPAATLDIPRVVETQEQDKDGRSVFKHATVIDHFPVPIISSDIKVDLHLDQRKKGLRWYSTYRAEFTARYELQSLADRTGDLVVSFAFPAQNGQYDDFRFELDGKPMSVTRGSGAGVSAVLHAPAPLSVHVLNLHYVSQGLETFTYRFADGIAEARDFQLLATTDFAGYDFPGNTMSPTQKTRTERGWELTWKYKSLVTGNGIGVAMPQKLDPGPMAARIAFFAPVSLGFFFFLTFVIAILRGLRIHPMNYFFLAAAFFAFHLLLGYLVDHISIHQAFAVCSVVSIFLCVSYLRIVVGNRFAFLEFALAQLVYLVGFSYAFFFEGFTGLTVTIGAIVTLFLVMQFTAKIDWAEKFQSGRG